MEWLQSLTEQGLLTPEQVIAIEAEGLESSSALEKVLEKLGVSSETKNAVLAAFFGVPLAEISNNTQATNDALNIIPEDSARYYRVVPLTTENDVLLLVTSDPENLQMRQAMHFISSKNNIPHKFLYADDAAIEKLLEGYESLSGEVDEALGSLEQQLQTEIESKEKQLNKKSESEKERLEHLKEDAPVTKIVATILRYAVDGKASDIHIEPTGGKVTVRFRVDGLLQKSLELPENVQSAVVARVKILSSMRLDEKRKPQDGRFSANFDGRKIDFRVSVLPTNHGEKVVMRILDTDKGVRTLEDTGIEPHHLKAIRRVVEEPYGIILISGPTGSGKSTTLYAMLSEVNRLTKNVLSLEDPVEYDIDNVSQSQVRPEIGYTFADGLRSALRQDPDIIMVGEIRDKETAQLAIQAALTGHLVLSTIHTNNAIGVIPRLIDMGVDPYLIAPTLKLAIAQRLARRICPGTGTEVPVDGAIKMMMDKEFETLPERFKNRIPQSTTMLHPEPSPGCASGTKGRAAVMEMFEVNEEIQELILNGGSEEDMYNVGRKHGFMSMKEDAIIKALRHVIPYEEIGTFGTKVGEESLIEEDALATVENTATQELSVPPEPESPETTIEQTTADLEKEIANVDNPSSDTLRDV